jgi:RNA polymerase sigma factor (sigma-70 family)
MIERQPPQAGDSAELLRRVAAGDNQAATDVFGRYVERLTALARSRLSVRLASRVDPEDVVQSAYRSFFAAAGRGQFEVRRGGDLWRLLVEVTLHKLYRSAQHHFAQQRSVGREQHREGSRDLTDFLVGNEPTPEEALAAADELQAAFCQMNDRDRHAVELRLQGYEHEEIAERLHCNERTVRRAVNQARRIIAARGGMDFVPSAARQRPNEASKNKRREKMPEIADSEAPLLWNNYLLHEQIGAGATGRVYRASQKSDGREFAIKFLRKSLTNNAAAVRRFAAEAKTVASLACSGIVRVHGIGKTPGGGLFLLMDLLSGPDLEQVEHRGDFAISRGVQWIAQAADSLHFAHTKGVIHCDLKPSNIVLAADGSARVTDFGFAVRQDEISNGLTRVAGTPAYMAPEQVDPDWGALCPQTDIWGLGGVLFFLFFGRPPHEGCDVPTTLANVSSKRPVVFPVDDTCHVPQAVREIVRQCLYKEPNERIQSALELARRLRSTAETME